MYLELWKFGIYISIPIFASVYYSNPETQRYWADYWQFIKYPENPNTNVREKIKLLAEEKGEQREQRLAYQRQLRDLQQAAERSENFNEENTEAKPSWWGRAGSKQESE
jgi:ABC-type Fe3+ transport system substrate-binding protein